MAESTPEVKYLITAKDLTKQAIDSADAGVRKFSKSLSVLSLATGAIAGAVVFKTMIEETLQQEKALKQLEARLISTKGVSGQTRDGLVAMADGLSKVTTFSDDAINSMQALLLQFTRVKGGEFVAAQEQILNVATALGTDLQSAAMQVGKALNDPIKGISQLGRAGIQFSEEQKEMIKTLVETGRTADAQKMILQGLETQFGGAAKAARQTLGGALESLKNSFGDLLEANGPGTESMRKSVEALIKVLQDPKTIAAAQSFTQTMIVGFTKLVDLMVEVKGFVDFLGVATAKALNGSADPIERIDEKIKDTNAELKMLGVQIQAIQHGAVIPGAEERFDELMNQMTELEKTRKMMVEEANRPIAPPKPAEQPGAQAFAGGIGTIEDPPVPGGMTEEQKEKELERIQEFLRTREELIIAQFTKEHDFIMANVEEGAARDDMLERLAEKHQKSLTDIQNKGLSERDKFLKMTTKNKLAFMLQSTMSELAGVAQTNKTLFKINKVATQANILVTAPGAIAESIKNAGGLPWGAWAGLLTAAKYVGLWQAASGVEFGSGGAPSAAGTGGGAPGMVDTPNSGMAPPRIPNEELSPRAGNSVQIVVHGNVIGMEQLQRVVGEALQQSVEDEIITISTDGRRANLTVN